MAHIVVLGAGTGGMPCAYELREMLGKEHEVTLINEKPEFQFTPSNPWVAVGWRDRSSVTFDIRPHVERKGISFIAKRCDKIDADNNTLTLDGDEEVKYNYLIIATGPRLAFEEVEGAGPGGGHTQSICTVDHALSAYDAYKDLLDDPGHVIIGAMPFASCFGPAYEFSFIMDSDLRKRKVRDPDTHDLRYVRALYRSSRSGRCWRFQRFPRIRHAFPPHQLDYQCQGDQG